MAADRSSPREAIKAMRLLGREGDALWAEYQLWMSEHVETFCPGCGHTEFMHVAGMCYNCQISGCGWSILGEGNAWGLPAGWHEWRSTV